MKLKGALPESMTRTKDLSIFDTLLHTTPGDYLKVILSGVKHAKIYDRDEMEQVREFCNRVKKDGLIFHLDEGDLDATFKKILEGIEDLNKIMDSRTKCIK